MSTKIWNSLQFWFLLWYQVIRNSIKLVYILQSTQTYTLISVFNLPGNDKNPGLLFTKRSNRLRLHSGAVSFPGKISFSSHRLNHPFKNHTNSFYSINLRRWSIRSRWCWHYWDCTQRGQRRGGLRKKRCRHLVHYVANSR